MSPETYEQTAVPEQLFGDAAAFLASDGRVTVSFAENGQPLSGASSRQWPSAAWLLLSSDHACTQLRPACLHAGAGELPPTVELRVSEADAYARGNSATSSYKHCILESGARLAVPPFVQSGDTVVVDTRSGSFVKRT